MHHVYTNAYCNIMASWASLSESIFATREPWIFDRLSIELPVKLDSDGPPARMTFISVKNNLWGTEVTESPLNRRAWVLQERLLSRRNLHFTKREVFWECPERACCESVSDLRFPRGADDDSDIKAPHWKLPITHNTYTERYGVICPPQSLAIYEKWADIVSVYTPAGLTFPSDKLVALGGVARQTKNLLNDAYISGHWLRYLPGDLLWRALPPGGLEDVFFSSSPG